MNGIVKLIVPIVAVLLALAVVLFAATDVWPYMHEVLWQQSWKPVCAGPDGSVVFCKP